MTTTKVFDTPEDIGQHVAGDILYGLVHRAGKPYLVGFPAGRSAVPVVDALVEQAHRSNLDLSQLHVVMMDDYVEPTATGYRRIDSELEHSCVGWALRRIADPLADLGFTPDHLLAPDPDNTAAVGSAIRSLGGVDLFVMASGQSDGHVALNGPGTPVDAATRIVGLSESTRIDNLSTFPHLRELDHVPHFGITLGTGDFVGLCHSVRMVVWGSHKSDAYAHLQATDAYDPDWPATIVHCCQDPAILADNAAASTTHNE